MKRRILEKNNNILTQLRDFEVNPPPDLQQRINIQISAYKQFGRGDAAIKRLLEYEKAPPIFLLKNILAKLGFAKERKVIRITNAWKIAAAASVILITGIFFFLAQTNKKVEPPVASVTPKETNVIASKIPTAVAAKQQPADIAKISTKMPSLSKVSSVKKPKHRESNVEVAPESNISEIILDGNPYKVENQDYFTFLTSFDYNNIPGFFKEGNEEKVLLYTDNSSAISVSDKMVKMLKRMYATRTNGKPTWRASLLKKKMTNWKKADNEYFDKTPGHDAINPIDLANFLLD